VHDQALVQALAPGQEAYRGRMLTYVRAA